MAMIYGRLTLDEMSQRTIGNPEVLDFAKRVSYSSDEQSLFPVEYDGEVTIYTKDGERLTYARAQD